MQVDQEPKVGRDMGETGRDKSLVVRARGSDWDYMQCVSFHMLKAKTVLVMVLQPLYITAR